MQNIQIRPLFQVCGAGNIWEIYSTFLWEGYFSNSHFWASLYHGVLKMYDLITFSWESKDGHMVQQNLSYINTHYLIIFKEDISENVFNVFNVFNESPYYHFHFIVNYFIYILCTYCDNNIIQLNFIKNNTHFPT